MGIFFITLAVLAVGTLLGLLLLLRDSRAELAAEARMRTVGTLLCIVIGSVLLLTAGGSSLYSWHFVSTSVRTTGKITALRSKTDSKDGTTRFAPSFTFQDSAGGEHLVSASVYSAPSQHQVGDSVGVLYRPTNPQGARIDAYMHIWGLPTATGVFGVILLPFGLWQMLRHRLVARFRGQSLVG